VNNIDMGSDTVNDPAYSYCYSNIYHHLNLFSAGNALGPAREFPDIQNLHTKHGVFKILWGLLFIPAFFWWDEITEMAFIILR